MNYLVLRDRAEKIAQEAWGQLGGEYTLMSNYFMGETRAFECYAVVVVRNSDKRRVYVMIQVDTVDCIGCAAQLVVEHATKEFGGGEFQA